MAAEPQPGAISAAFPAPPPFYKSFSLENLERLQQYIDPLSQTSTDTLRSSGPAIPSIANLASLPAEIHHLVPPAPPIDGKYRSFGVLHNINPSLSVPQKIPTRENLLDLTDRLMRLFRRYVQILATNPSGELWVRQWEEIKRTLEEVHGIINEYRPHEARESLILKYEDQIRQVKEETERVKSSVDRARKVVAELGGSALRNGDLAVHSKDTDIETEAHRATDKKEMAIAREKLVLDAIEREVGGASI